MSLPADTLSKPTLAHLFRSLVQLLADMWDYSVRFGFGTRAPNLDEEASAPLLTGYQGSPMTYGAQLDTDTCSLLPERRVSATEPSRQHEQSDLEVMLAPVHEHLEKLKNTTPPPYNPQMRTKSHAQVIKTRLLTIGAFVVTDLLAHKSDAEKGLLELDICHHIATHYWPLPVTSFTHLYILEIYRNAQYRLAAKLDG